MIVILDGKIHRWFAQFSGVTLLERRNFLSQGELHFGEALVDIIHYRRHDVHCTGLASRVKVTNASSMLEMSVYCFTKKFGQKSQKAWE